MLKKVMSAVLAGVMTLALAVPVFATGSSATNATNPESTNPSAGLANSWYTNNANGSGAYNSADASGAGLQGAQFTTRYTAETKVPYLDVVITGNGGLILNPYRVEYTSKLVNWGGSPSASWNLASSGQNGGSGDTTVHTYGAEQIISTDITITSKTLVPVLVGAKVAAEVASSNSKLPVTLSATAIAEADQTKNAKKVCLWLGAGATHDAAITNGKKALDKTATADSDNCKQWLLISTATNPGATGTNIKWNTNERIFMLAKTSGTEATKKTCVLTFGGQMVQQPLNNPWVPGDKITPTLVIDLQVQKNYGMPSGT